MRAKKGELTAGIEGETECTPKAGMSTGGVYEYGRSDSKAVKTNEIKHKEERVVRTNA